MNTKLPAVGSCIIYTSRDYVDEEKIAVYQSRQRRKGERTSEMNGVKLATISVTGFHLRPAGEITLKMMWECDYWGDLYATVLDVTDNYRVLINRQRIEW